MIRTMQPMMLAGLALLLAIHLVVGRAGSPSEELLHSCVYHANTNITSTDMEPPKFVVSSQDCCDLCSVTNGCAAAVFSDYYCHLKRSDSNQVATQGSVVVVPATTTTTTTSSTTTTTTSAAPTTTTAAPTAPPGPPMGLIRQVTCSQSSACNPYSDGTCNTNVFYNNTCFVNNLYSCDASVSMITWNSYADLGCEGNDDATSFTAGQCMMNQTTNLYSGYYCDVVPTPVANIPVTRTKCPEGCATGGDCSTAHFITGQCIATDQLQGLWTIAWCFPNYVVYNSFSYPNCTGLMTFSTAEPVGSECFPSANQAGYTQNICGP
ncbi:Hypothetical protein, putative [Bodo saltans]|uniref:Membrane-associated protein n=1 Tax=Bodo saltans TaxID=75058 RepID=A0A0S4J658_BODSA|nr:Hypothetical protein, putative [Bodo saltans]|eukprot:CUG86940.1 Hypothetical protein, putative [Bodo saltans]